MALSAFVEPVVGETTPSDRQRRRSPAAILAAFASRRRASETSASTASLPRLSLESEGKASSSSSASDPPSSRSPSRSPPRSSERRWKMPFRQRLGRHFDTPDPDTPYLSYYDVLLTYDDIKSLKNDWLTDNNITFWEEWLEREVLPKYPQAHICLLRPTMTLLLMKQDDPASVKSALPNLSKVTHIFLPINDARDVRQAESGSHWSLLLVSVIDRVAFHYDSLGSSNYNEARSCTNKLQKVLGIPLRFHNIDDSPQQDNGSDCGVFVCILMRHLLVKKLLNANAREKVSMSMKDKMIDSYGGRKEMLKIIESLRKEGERRRSASPFATASTATPPRIE